MHDKVIGLTGGIGSGKTAAADRFEALGITVVDADLASRFSAQDMATLRKCLIRIAGLR